MKSVNDNSQYIERCSPTNGGKVVSLRLTKGAECQRQSVLRQSINFISFLLCFVLCSSFAFAEEVTVTNNKESELEQLKIEIERLKTKKNELEFENNKLNNLLNQNTNTDNSKIREQLKEKLSKLTDDNNKKEKELKQKEEELKKLIKEKSELNIKKTELKKDLEFRKKEVIKAEELLKNITEDNEKISNDYNIKVQEINIIEDKYGLERTVYPPEKNFTLANNNSCSNNEKPSLLSLIDKDINKNYNYNNSNEINICDFTYSSGFNYCDFKLNANNLNNSVKMSIYKDNGNIIKLFDYSVFRFNKEKNYFEFSWDLKDLVGNSVGKGKYIAKIEVKGQVIKTLEIVLKY